MVCFLCFVFRFGVDLQISDKLFVMDAGASNSKDVKLLRSHLQELRANIISVSKHTQIQIPSPVFFPILICVCISNHF